MDFIRERMFELLYLFVIGIVVSIGWRFGQILADHLRIGWIIMGIGGE